ncbi:hypothetical protein B0H14DRAFT_3868081, partial [Mycena olivaceomarginata]
QQRGTGLPLALTIWLGLDFSLLSLNSLLFFPNHLPLPGHRSQSPPLSLSLSRLLSFSRVKRPGLPTPAAHNRTQNASSFHHPRPGHETRDARRQPDSAAQAPADGLSYRHGRV